KADTAWSRICLPLLGAVSARRQTSPANATEQAAIARVKLEKLSREKDSSTNNGSTPGVVGSAVARLGRFCMNRAGAIAQPAAQAPVQSRLNLGYNGEGDLFGTIGTDVQAHWRSKPGAFDFMFKPGLAQHL